MRVGLNGYFWDRPRTGSGQYLRHLWAALREEAADEAAERERVTSLVLLAPEGSPSLPGRGTRTRTIVHRPPQRLPGSYARKIWWEEIGVEQAARRARIHLLHSPYLSAPLLSRGPVVVTAHDVIPWVVPGYAESPAFRLYLALAAAGVRRARLVMADSEASRRDAIRALRLPERRVRTVYLGVEPPPRITRGAIEEVSARFGLPERYAFYMGGFDKRKNVPLLLRAWKDVMQEVGDDAVLAIGGEIPKPGGLFPDVRGEAACLGFDQEGSSGPVRFLGSIEEEDKPLLMAGAHLFVYPSEYEGFGLDPLEAMSLGTPVVSSWGGSLREVVGEGGLLTPPGDEEALARAMRSVWCDPKLRTELQKRGPAHASSFTWERTAAETAKAYADAVAVPKRARA